LVGYPLQDQLRTIVSATDRSPQQVAAFLQSEVPVNAIVETWEPELGFLSDHRFHYPPLGWLDRAVRARWLQPDAATLSGYDPGAEIDPAYLVVGPFGKYTGIYASSITRPTSRRMTSIGEYDVYRLR
jgi:hypothetical protein